MKKDVLPKERIISILQDNDFGIYLRDGMQRLGQIKDAEKFYEVVVKYDPNRFKDCTTPDQVLIKANLGFAGAANLTSEDMGVVFDKQK